MSHIEERKKIQGKEKYGPRQTVRTGAGGGMTRHGTSQETADRPEEQNKF